MTVARKQIVNEDEVGLYHCISRCVRKASLCGHDEQTGKDYGHRQGWIRERMEFLADIFTIDIAGYSLLSNHMHCNCRTRPDLRDILSDEEVVLRWKTVYPGTRKRRKGVALPTPEVFAALVADKESVAKWRRRLGNLGEYMKALKETIARWANREDDCTGHFWEGRYKAQPILDDAALLASMTYVDLNPIRARIARTPEESVYTSAYDRIQARQADKKLEALQASRSQNLSEPAVAVTATLDEMIAVELRRREADAWLAPLERTPEDRLGGRMGILPMSLEAYLELLDWTGRQIREGKSGAIPANLASILERLKVDCENWVETVTQYGRWFRRVAGKIDSLSEAAKRMGLRWLQGKGRSAQAFVSIPNTG